MTHGMEWRAEPDDPTTERLWMGERPTSNTRGTGRVPRALADSSAIPLSRVTTLAEIPGHQIVRVVGAITELSATSGLTATEKRNAALDMAMSRLRGTARENGANAIVGLNTSVFGAKGGVTSAFGGDAVGVLLIGTAVVVEKSAAEDEETAPKGS